MGRLTTGVTATNNDCIERIQVDDLSGSRRVQRTMSEPALDELLRPRRLIAQGSPAVEGIQTISFHLGEAQEDAPNADAVAHLQLNELTFFERSLVHQCWVVSTDVFE